MPDETSDAAIAALRAAPAREHEAWEGDGPCKDCGRASPMWRAPVPLWNAVMGDGTEGLESAGGVICPVCFVRRAWLRKAEGWDQEWNWGCAPLDLVPAADLLAERAARRAAEAALRATPEGEAVPGHPTPWEFVEHPRVPYRVDVLDANGVVVVSMHREPGAGPDLAAFIVAAVNAYTRPPSGDDDVEGRA